MSKEQIAYIMIGLPGSGKSYYAKKRQNENNFIIVNRDAFRAAFFGGIYRYSEKVEPIIKNIVENSIKTFLINEFNIIVDETNLTKNKRKNLINLIHSVRPKTKIIYVWCSEQKNNLKYRMRESKGQSEEIWNQVIHLMQKNYEKPNASELKEFSVEIEEIKI